MNLQELNNMIESIKELPDNLLIQVLMATTKELLKRTSKSLERLREDFGTD